MSENQEEVLKLTWRDVFNTSHKHWGHIAPASDGAYHAGYNYFSWNGRIYATSTGRETGLLVEDVT